MCLLLLIYFAKHDGIQIRLPDDAVHPEVQNLRFLHREWILSVFLSEGILMHAELPATFRGAKVAHKRPRSSEEGERWFTHECGLSWKPGSENTM